MSRQELFLTNSRTDNNININSRLTVSDVINDHNYHHHENKNHKVAMNKINTNTNTATTTTTTTNNSTNNTTNSASTTSSPSSDEIDNNNENIDIIITSISVTPLPWKQLSIISLILFCNSFMLTCLLPFISFMLIDFGFPDDEIGRYSGYLVASYMFGQLLFSYFWGRMSDIWGRKPVMIIGLAGSGVACLLFGFSPNYSFAILIRLICGGINAIVGVTKSYLSEITDETNQGKGFALIGLNRALGMIVGPVVGGFLASPVEKYPNWFPSDSFLVKYPYCLPTIAGFLLSIVGAICAIYFLSETKAVGSLKTLIGNSVNSTSSSIATRPSTRINTESEPPFFSGIRNMFSSTRECDIDNEDIEQQQPLLVEDRTDFDFDYIDDDIEDEQDQELYDDETAASASNSPHHETSFSHQQNIIFNNDEKPGSLSKLLKDKIISKSILLYTMISFYYIIYDEIFAVWSRLPIEEGGLGFDSRDIGIAFSFGGIVLLIYQSMFYSIIERKLGVLKAFQSGVLLSIPAFLMLTRSNIFFRLGYPTIGWCVILLSQGIRTVTSLQAFTSSFIMVSNSCFSSSRGAVNGIGQSFGSLSRMLGPIFGGIVFSWSMEHPGLPHVLDYHLIFNLLVLFSLLTFAVSLTVPSSINRRRTI